jgi:hypothetical protein
MSPTLAFTTVTSNIIHAVILVCSSWSWSHLLVSLDIVTVSLLPTSRCPCLAVKIVLPFVRHGFSVDSLALATCS